MIKEGLVISKTEEVLDKKYNSIKGYTSNVTCPICHLDIMVKNGSLEGRFIWALCQICHDKGWKIPRISLGRDKLVYTNYRTGEVKLVDLQ